MQTRRIIPKLSSSLTKGQAGRIAVIGGSAEYTGAPYFAGISALRTGCDLAHVICTSDASTAIKSYSPELIVHPILKAKSASIEEIDESVEAIQKILGRMDVVIIGPGLSRDPTTINIVLKVIAFCVNEQMMLVLDADGLYIAQKYPDSIEGYPRCVLTPNHNELERLVKSCVALCN